MSGGLVGRGAHAGVPLTASSKRCSSVLSLIRAAAFGQGGRSFRRTRRPAAMELSEGPGWPRLQPRTASPQLPSNCPPHTHTHGTLQQLLLAVWTHVQHPAPPPPVAQSCTSHILPPAPRPHHHPSLHHTLPRPPSGPCGATTRRRCRCRPRPALFLARCMTTPSGRAGAGSLTRPATLASCRRVGGWGWGWGGWKSRGRRGCFPTWHACVRACMRAVMHVPPAVGPLGPCVTLPPPPLHVGAGCRHIGPSASPLLSNH